MNFEHVLKFVGVILLMGLLAYLGPIGAIGNLCIMLAALWQLTA